MEYLFFIAVIIAALFIYPRTRNLLLSCCKSKKESSSQPSPSPAKQEPKVTAANKAEPKKAVSKPVEKTEPQKTASKPVEKAVAQKTTNKSVEKPETKETAKKPVEKSANKPKENKVASKPAKKVEEKPAAEAKMPEPVAENTGCCSEAPEDSTLKRHYLASQQMKEEVTPESKKCCSETTQEVSEQPAETHTCQCSAHVPEDSSLKRHYLCNLKTEFEARFGDRPEELSLQRHYDAMLLAELNNLAA